MNSRLKLVAVLSTIGLICGCYFFFSPSLKAALQEPLDVPSQEQLKEQEKPNFSVRQTEVVDYSDLQKQHPMDLKDPENVTTEVVYDYATGMYILTTKVGDMVISTPFVMTADEYKQYSQQQQMQAYWQEKNAEAQSQYEDKFNLTDMKFSLGPADKLFGPGGVQVKTQGSAELTFGILHNRVDDYSLSERLRKKTSFDFDQNIQINVNATVGDKIGFNLGYNTEASFDFDQQNLKLAYEGKEDDIIQKLEAGNVSMSLNSALIRGSSSLLGVRTDLQFGKLSVQAVAALQQSSSQRVNSNGATQTMEFEVAADNYDENRHYFLSQYFRDTYDRNMSDLPYITSGVIIERIEVWVTNKRGHFDQARNIIAFADLAESKVLNNSHWIPSGQTYPANETNSLYHEIINIPSIRDIQQFNALMEGTYPAFGITGGEDYEKIESARRLDPSEYTFNSTLGFISLNTALNADEVLAVAFEYRVGGKTYQVGEFSTDGIEPPRSLVVKLLKGTAISPYTTVWDLMMKNIYSLGAYSIQQENFKLNVMYKNDSAGIYLNYIPAGNIKDKVLLKVMNLDRLDSYNNARPDGKFDFVEGYTIISSNGRLIFPVVEPFGEHLRKAIGNNAIADKYVFQELYDSTLTVAREISEKNKFKMTGQYQGSSNSEIRLNAMNIPRGSVVVTAGGVQLTENVDYTVDYIMGTVTIINASILSSNTPVDVQLENQDMFNMQRKSLFGTHLEYAFNKNFSVGGTVMHLTEMPMITKTGYGSEPIANTIWGLNVALRQDAPWLTKALNSVPLLNATAPSNIVFNAEMAHLIPGHRKLKNNPGYAYLDDFEATETGIDLRYPHYWTLASTPQDPINGGLFPEASLSNNTNYGKNRALFSWFIIDNNVFNKNNSTTPSHIRNDLNMRSNHLTREITEQEIFPNKESTAGATVTYLSPLNISFYPQERGPYNLDDLNIDPNTGLLLNPKARWGGMMRKLDVSDFEQANIEYIEFWLMDPFVNDSTNTMTGGDLYFNLGDISEDILKDGKKSFENGMPANGDTTQTERTIWGRVPTAQSTVLAFSTDANARQFQDIGFNGLRTAEEFEFSTYKKYLDNLRVVLTPAAIAAMEADQFSPFNDPAGDNYHHYRGSDYDAEKRSILERYKYYNNTEGNSPDATKTTETFSTSGSNIPDIEDINQDNTLNEYEKYYQYRVSLRKSDLNVGQGYITDRRDVNEKLANGQTSPVTWYQFKIPIREGSKIGAIRDFKSIRFMRIFMHDFEEPMHLRFGTLELVRGEWRTYNKDLYPISTPPTTNGTIVVSSVNIEENSNKEPVNYVIPPGVSRETDPSQPQLRQQNEQAMVIKVFDLAPSDSRAVYKNIGYDMRQYKRLQLFTHAEKMLEDIGTLRDYELSVFIRVGSDHTNNYYEYEVPLKLTPAGQYNNSTADQVWPESNMLDFPLELFTQVKLQRNKARAAQGSSASMTKPYSEYDPEKPQNKVTVMGNPNLGDVETIMIGVRNNNSNGPRSGEIWINELRLTDYNEDGGVAALGNLVVGLSDLGSVSVSGRVETAGFGGIEQSLGERRLDDYYQFNISTAFELGRFFPEKAKVQIPFYFSYSIENSKPKYNPLDQDILLTDALAEYEEQAAKDSILTLVQTQTITKSLNFTNVRVDHRGGKRPQIYDPANFSATYAYNHIQQLNPETERDARIEHRGSLNYNYSNSPTPWEPFKKTKKLDKIPILKDFNLNYAPHTLALAINVNRLYSETQLRDLEGSMLIDRYDPSNPLLSSSKSFMWDRMFNFGYDLSKSIKFTFRSSTNSRIDETMYSPINKHFFPDEFENWKDTVRQSLSTLGTPLVYQQAFVATWAIPINKIPGFDFISANAAYNASYNWDLGAQTSSGMDMGNLITNLNSWQIDGQFRFETLYNKSKYLKEVNTKLSRTRRTSGRTPSRFTPKQFSTTIATKKGETATINHRLNSSTLKVEMFNSKGKSVKYTYKVVNQNSIAITAKANIDSLTVKIETLNPNEPQANGFSLYAVRFLMMLRTASISYKETNGLTIPGFNNGISFFGQQRAGGILSPGLEFAFGKPDISYVHKAAERGWLVDSILNPAAQNFSSDLDIKANIEPIPGLVINLTAKHIGTRQSTVQHMYADMPTTFNGSFQMTHIAIGTAFWSKDMSKGNQRAFDQFETNRQIIADRLQGRYTGTRYPTTGFMENSGISGIYDPNNGAYTLSSSDVLIPAFFAAYSNRDINSTKTDVIPTLWSLLPNWSVSFSGLSNIGWIAKHFKSVTLNHAYQCSYSINSFSSYSNYVTNEDGLGFVRDVTSGNPIPSSAYDIASVVISENFMPLIGIDVALNNNFTTRLEYKRQRTIALNITSLQVAESYNNGFTLGVGYIIKDFDIILKLKTNKTKKVKNDLTTRLDFTLSDVSTLLHKIDSEDVPQATAGNKTITVKFSADYVFSSKLNFRFFYDYQTNAPYLLTSYPMSNTSFGLSIRFMLTR